jgi:hypothetical protein
MLALLAAPLLKWLAGNGLGLLGGAVSELFKALQDRRDKAHELSVMQAQIEAAKATAAAHLDEVRVDSAAKEVEGDQAQIEALIAAAKPTGITFVDAVNGLMRPLAAGSAILIFDVMALAFLLGLLRALAAGEIGYATALHEFSASLFADVIVSVMGFLFGYRIFAAGRSGR